MELRGAESSSGLVQVKTVSLLYQYRLRVTRANPNPGTQDPETGVITPGGPDIVVYDNKADVQDAGEAIPRTATGQPTKEADATAFLFDEKAGLAIEPDDVATVYYPDGETTAEGEVRFVREMDGAVLIRYR
jgi:hypothetical protein